MHIECLLKNISKVLKHGFSFLLRIYTKSFLDLIQRLLYWSEFYRSSKEGKLLSESWDLVREPFRKTCLLNYHHVFGQSVSEYYKVLKLVLDFAAEFVMFWMMFRLYCRPWICVCSSTLIMCHLQQCPYHVLWALDLAHCHSSSWPQFRPETEYASTTLCL